MSKTEKREKFVRLANNRVNIVLDKLRLIGNLSDKRYYEYTDQDVKAIISSIQNYKIQIRLIVFLLHFLNRQVPGGLS